MTGRAGLEVLHMPATQIAVFVLLLLHILQFAAYPEAMNLRTRVAVAGFLLMATFATRHESNNYSICLLQLFGLLGALEVTVSLLRFMNIFVRRLRNGRP